MGESGKIFVSGVITIGIITALFLNGRNTAGVVKATGSATTDVLGTAITGKK